MFLVKFAFKNNTIPSTGNSATLQRQFTPPMNKSDIFVSVTTDTLKVGGMSNLVLR
jgi:hypothetical protein